MKCLRCDHEVTKILDSRQNKNFKVRRRHLCVGCGAKFTTVEVPVELDESGKLRKELTALRERISLILLSKSKSEDEGVMND